MANAEHLKIFKRGVVAWNRWRQKHRGLKPDLSDADLRRANFRYANLNDANLEYANLEGANLGRAFLEGAELHGASQRGAHLFSADLRHADLREADLREAQLWNAHLEGTDLRATRLMDADLRHCDLTGANLRDADLERCNLSGANFLRTDLTGARLTGACLHGSRFAAARLEGADLSHAEVALTAFDGVDLSAARGLDTVIHLRPSSIGVDTLERTAAGLDAALPRQEVLCFLRAAGVPEAYLARLSAGGLAPAPAVTLVHSRADRGFAGRLYGELQGRGIRCWQHEHPMLPGEDLDRGFDLGPRTFDRLVLCCSEASLTSWWLAAELDRVTERSRQIEEELGRCVEVLRPVNLGGTGSSEVWETLRTPRNLPPTAADFSGWEDDEASFENSLERLIETLHAA